MQMVIVKGQKMKMVDVYTVDGIDFSTEDEARKYHADQVEKKNQLLFEISYAPAFQDKTVVYTKKFFVSIKKKESAAKINVALIVALNQLAQKHKGLFNTHTFKKSPNDKNPITVDGFKVDQVKFKDAAEYNEITQRPYKVNGKFASVKTYKTNEFGNILEKEKGRAKK